MENLQGDLTIYLPSTYTFRQRTQKIIDSWLAIGSPVIDTILYSTAKEWTQAKTYTGPQDLVEANFIYILYDPSQNIQITLL